MVNVCTGTYWCTVKKVHRRLGGIVLKAVINTGDFMLILKPIFSELLAADYPSEKANMFIKQQGWKWINWHIWMNLWKIAAYHKIIISACLKMTLKYKIPKIQPGVKTIEISQTNVSWALNLLIPSKCSVCMKTKLTVKPMRSTMSRRWQQSVCESPQAMKHCFSTSCSLNLRNLFKILIASPLTRSLKSVTVPFLVSSQHQVTSTSSSMVQRVLSGGHITVVTESAMDSRRERLTHHAQ